MVVVNGVDKQRIFSLAAAVRAGLLGDAVPLTGLDRGWAAGQDRSLTSG
jgi:hypothetical protein